MISKEVRSRREAFEENSKEFEEVLNEFSRGYDVLLYRSAALLRGLRCGQWNEVESFKERERSSRDIEGYRVRKGGWLSCRSLPVSGGHKYLCRASGWQIVTKTWSRGWGYGAVIGLGCLTAGRQTGTPELVGVGDPSELLFLILYILSSSRDLH